MNTQPLFENPFSIEDMLVFDDVTMQRMFSMGGFGLTLEDLAASLCGASEQLISRVSRNLPREQQKTLSELLYQSVTSETVQSARRRVLDALFWELTYWKTPELYEELTEGEQLHPDIFRQLAADLCGKMVLDIGAGSGRASFECLCHGAKLVYAIEPSPGLLHILAQKLKQQPANNRIVIQRGSFDSIPLQDDSVDVSLSCSAFTADPEQGGEPGLAEMRRVTKRGGKIVLIWPRREDHAWLIAHGFQYVVLPLQQEMRVRFRSLQSALHCARLFYAHNRAVQRYILQHRKPEVPFSVLEINPPHDYCWLTVS
nr:methyltransferase domain-containing protein [Ktedonobacteraceae bacterium]